MRQAVFLCGASCLLTLLTGCHDKTSAEAPEVTKRAGDEDPGVQAGKEAQERAGIRVAALEPRPLVPEFTAYGHLEEDPSSSFTVRAVFSGTLRALAGVTWPALGQSMPNGAVLGEIEPRLSTTDRISLNTQLATAHADLSAASAAVTAAQSAYDRVRSLNADNKNVSDRVVQDAAAKLTSERAREEGARQTIRILETSTQSAGPSTIAPVTAASGGEVVEILAHPGESVEQGAPLVRLARFDHLLARIEIPMGEELPPASAIVRISPAGAEETSLPALRVGVAAAADSNTQGTTVLYRLARTLPGLRPGTAVTAHFTLPGSRGQGMLIPRAAVVEQDGRFWVYIQTKDNWFARRPLDRELATSAGYVAAEGFSSGDRIVVTGAQSLLSEEFKARNEADTN